MIQTAEAEGGDVLVEAIRSMVAQPPRTAREAIQAHVASLAAMDPDVPPDLNMLRLYICDVLAAWRESDGPRVKGVALFTMLSWDTHPPTAAVARGHLEALEELAAVGPSCRDHGREGGGVARAGPSSILVRQLSRRRLQGGIVARARSRGGGGGGGVLERRAVEPAEGDLLTHAEREVFECF